jgi:hypothetical protein
MKTIRASFNVYSKSDVPIQATSISYCPFNSNVLAVGYSNSWINIIDHSNIDDIFILKGLGTFRSNSTYKLSQRVNFEWSYDGRYLACYISTASTRTAPTADSDDGKFMILETRYFAKV